MVVPLWLVATDGVAVAFGDALFTSGDACLSTGISSSNVGTFADYVGAPLALCPGLSVK